MNELINDGRQIDAIQYRMAQLFEIWTGVEGGGGGGGSINLHQPNYYRFDDQINAKHYFIHTNAITFEYTSNKTV